MTGTDDNILSGNIWLFIAFVIINYTNKYTPILIIKKILKYWVDPTANS